ncbi:hypothetical protein POTOM_052977 [Populus tomentosa]|uniref:MADS-box domain-containing protein n=1 Tax=Populus tomentosa TaxID=118781 RepID=A0A8X8C0R8_POPTO|nr:hypothetical protein POTOM_052977 [Populus tomentosa]
MDATDLNRQRHQQETRRTSKGRQKIEIKKVEKESNRYVTFSKRKKGLFKKATELSTLCGAETAVIVFSEHRKLFSCGQPDVDKVLDRYLDETERVPDNFPPATNKNIESQLANKQEYARSLKRLEEEQTVAKMIGNMNDMNEGGFWWDLPFDSMEQDELEAYKESMEQLKKNVITRLGLIEANNAPKLETLAWEQDEVDGVLCWTNDAASSCSVSFLLLYLFPAMAGGNFMHRVLSYVVNELVVNSLANSECTANYQFTVERSTRQTHFPAFQRFAVRTSRRIDDISNTAAKKKKELAEQVKDLSKNFESFKNQQ